MRAVARFADLTMHPGIVANGNPTVLTNGRPTAALLDPCTCGLHGMASIVGGNASVLVGGMPIARVLDPVSCFQHGPPPVYTPPTETRLGDSSGRKASIKGHHGKFHLEQSTPDGREKVTIDYERGPYEHSAEKADIGGQGHTEMNQGRMTITKQTEGDFLSESEEVELKGVGYEGDVDAWAGTREGRSGVGLKAKGGVSGGSVKRSKDTKLKLFGLNFGARRSAGLDAGEGNGGGASADWDANKRRFSVRGELPLPGKGVGGFDAGLELYVEAQAPETDKLPNFILTGSPDVFSG